MSRPQTASDGTRQSLLAEQSEFSSPRVAVGGGDGAGKRTARRHVHRCYSPLPITSSHERGLCGVRHMAKTFLEWYMVGWSSTAAGCTECSILSTVCTRSGVRGEARRIQTRWWSLRPGGPPCRLCLTEDGEKNRPPVVAVHCR